MLDAVIIGAGTAGMTAGIYLARRGKSAVIFENNAYGGQIINSLEIANYPGIKNVSGFDFSTGLYEQVTALGGRIEFANVEKIQPNGNVKTVITSGGEYKCKSIIIACGASNRKLGLANEDELIGRGVSYCATCDGAFYRGMNAAVVGGGNTALDDAIFLADICKRVYLIHRRDEFRGDINTVEQLKTKENVEFILSSEPTELICGDDGNLSGVKVHDKISSQNKILNISGLFVAVGQVPNTAFLAESGINLDPYGYIIASEDCRTNIDGVYAAGDCRTKTLRQLTTAAADGSVAGSAAG